MNIAYFISPHGFGHASRACAVMTILARNISSVSFSIFTRVPEWFFERSFNGDVKYTYYDRQTDVGFIQSTSMLENYDATIRALENLYPLRDDIVEKTALTLKNLNIDAVFNDICVLGISAANYASIPSVLIENFTWDWIYSSYVSEEPRFQKYIEYLKPLFDQATLRIQSEPVCVPTQRARVVPPLARRLRAPKDAVRLLLQVPDSAPMVMCTMGGVPGDFSFMPKLAEVKDVFFVLAGLEPLSPPPPNVRAIPHTSNLYHPDLVAAADAVVGKVGYSTVAEAYYGRTQFLYIPRPRFPESRVMEAFVRRELNGIEIPQSDFETGSWASHVKELLTPLPQKDISPDQTAGSLLRALESILHTRPAA